MKFKDALSLSEEKIEDDVVVIRGSVHQTETDVRTRCIELLLSSSEIVDNTLVLDHIDGVAREMHRTYDKQRRDLEAIRSLEAEREILTSELEACKRELSSEKALRAKADRVVSEHQRRPKIVERNSSADKSRISELEQRLSRADRELEESRREASTLRERTDSLEASALLMEKRLVAELQTSSELQFKLSQNSPQSVFSTYSLFGSGLDITLPRCAKIQT
jgi:septal ring factor EnvC (AmiA/AmiB activator)